MLGTIMTKPLAEELLKNICTDYIEGFLGKGCSYVQKYMKNKSIEKKIEDMADFFSIFEQDKCTMFLSDIQAAFSKDNIRQIISEVKKENTFDLEGSLEDKLMELCTSYRITEECDYIVSSIIELFFELMVDSNPDLAQKLFFNRLARQHAKLSSEHFELRTMLTSIDTKTSMILASIPSYELQTSFTKANYYSEGNCVVGSDEDLFSWNIEFHTAESIFGNQEQRLSNVRSLISHWKKEREEYPGWYVAPSNRRHQLIIYTRDESLLWKTELLSFQEKLDFAYELVWRYETGMDLYNQPLQKNIYAIWKNFTDLDLWTDSENNKKWFYIGQALLREFREDMNWSNWDYVIRELSKKKDIISSGDDELTLEFIKQLFFRMQISDVRDKLQQFKCPKNRYAIRLQKYGLMAECGLLYESYTCLRKLIDDLKAEYLSIENDNKRWKVYIGSIISCTFQLFSFVIQGLHSFESMEELTQIWKNQEPFEKYFDLDSEKHQWNNDLYNFYCKHREIPFELDRINRTQHWGSDGLEYVYSFYRVLDHCGQPLHLGMTLALPHQEIEFIKAIINRIPLLGAYLLLRTGNNKAVKIIISREFCINLGFDSCRNIFDYVFHSLDQNIDSIRVNGKRGNAYAHLLYNGLEILRRLISVATIAQQKKIISLMCKLIDSNIVQEYRVMDKWIQQVLRVIDEKVKAQYLNELLMASTKDRSIIKDERELDPFEVISSSISARKYYEESMIDSAIIDKLIAHAKESEEECEAIIPRLYKLNEWRKLSDEQKKEFCDLTWSKVNSETKLPNFKQYYAAAFIEWPAPPDTDTKTLVNQYIMQPKWYDKLSSTTLNAITMGSARIYDELRCINATCPDVLSIEDREKILTYFLEYWNNGKKAFDANENKDFFEEEFLDRFQELENVIATFSFNEESINHDLKASLNEMFSEMKTYGICVLAAMATVCESTDDLAPLMTDIIDMFYSDQKEDIIDAANAAEILISKWPDSEIASELLSEQIRLIRYGRHPGLQSYFITIHNLACKDKLKLTDQQLILINKALSECAQYSSYDKISKKSETELKEMLLLRCSCASTAYQLSKYISNNPQRACCTEGIDMWKEICVGKNQQDEFLEIKRAWLQ